MPFLITTYCLLFAFIAFRKIDWAILIIVAALPSYLIRFQVFDVPLTLLEAMILILFAVWFLPPFIRGGLRGGIKTAIKPFFSNSFFWPIVAILVTATISVFISPNLRGALGVYKAYFIEPLLFFFVLVATIKSRKGIEGLIWALGVSAVYLGVIAVAQKISGLEAVLGPLGYVPSAFLNSDGSVDRTVSILGYPNALGLYLGPIIILFAGFLFWKKEKIISQAIKVFIIALSFLTIVLAKSEGAILSVVVVLAVWSLFNKKTRLYALTFIVLGAIILSFSQPLLSAVIQKITLQDYSGFVHRLIWGESWKMLGDNWLFGAGLAGYQMKIAPYHLKTFEIFLYPHSIILNFWSELGLLGLAAFIWLIIKFFWININSLPLRRGSWNDGQKRAKGASTNATLGAFVAAQDQKERGYNLKNNIIAATLIAVMAQIIIHGLVDAPYFKNDLSILFWLIVAMAVIQFNLKKSDI